MSDIYAECERIDVEHDRTCLKVSMSGVNLAHLIRNLSKRDQEDVLDELGKEAACDYFGLTGIDYDGYVH